MPAELNEAEFSKHVHTPFRLDLGDNAQIDLELIEVKSYANNPGDEDGMERFSLIFKGPANSILEQRLYSLNHDRMGAVDIFLVPIQPQPDGSRYEAVFNFYKSS